MKRGEVAALGLAGLAALLLLGSSQSDGSQRPAPKSEPPTVKKPSSLPGEPEPNQSEIVNALESSISEQNLSPLQSVNRRILAASGPIRAYYLAATRRAIAAHKDLDDYIRTFNERESEAQKKRDQDLAAGVGIGGAIAAAANVIPVIGQAVSAVIALGLAIGSAIAKSEALPKRKPEDQIHPGYEGVQTFLGLGLSPGKEVPFIQTYLELKQAVVQDPVAFELPTVPIRTTFPWTPTFADFHEAAAELGLYAR